jgi:hypothetical protein
MILVIFGAPYASISPRQVKTMATLSWISMAPARHAEAAWNDTGKD